MKNIDINKENNFLKEAKKQNDIFFDTENKYSKEAKKQNDKSLETENICWLCNTNKNLTTHIGYGISCLLCIEKMKHLQMW